MDCDNTNQMILERYKLIFACININFQGYVLFKPILKELFNGENKLSNEDFEKFNQLYDGVLVSTLLLDDVQDDSQLRIGKPTVHRLYGTNAVINCCMNSQVLMFKEIAKIFPIHKQAQALKIFTKGMITALCGQGMDIYWRDTVQCPIEEHYTAMIQAKTAHLCVVITSLLKLYKDHAVDYGKLFLLFGTYVQLRNDYVNFKSKQYTKLTGFCEDITEGKFSLPIIHAITSNPQDTSLINILKQHTDDIELKKHFLNCLEKFGSLEYTWKKTLEVNAQVKEEIAQLGGMPYFEEMIEATLDVEKTALF